VSVGPFTQAWPGQMTANVKEGVSGAIQTGLAARQMTEQMTWQHTRVRGVSVGPYTQAWPGQVTANVRDGCW